MITINMLSSADKIKGQGVGSAYEEQVSLIEQSFPEKFEVHINSLKPCDITHYHTVDLKHFLSIPFAKLSGKTVGYVHFLPETIEGSLRLPPIAKRVFYRYLIDFYKSMDMLVTVNPCFIERLAKYGIDRDKVVYIPNYVSSESFYRVLDEDKASLRLKYDLDPNVFTVVCAGQMQVRKGFFDFIRIAESLPDVQFVWAGGFSFGKMTDGYDEIKKIASDPPKNVRLPGIVPREQMNEVYNLADVMLLPSYEELFPMTVLEAMNCGVPLLLRDLELYEDILFDFYETAHDNGEFISKLQRMICDPTYYEKCRNASSRGAEFYSREHVAAMWQRFYCGLIQKRFKRMPAHR